MIGIVLKDRYQITQVLGEGGMATVYLANDKINNRKVAIKIIKDTEATALNVARFNRELKAAAALTHRNIVSVYDCGEYEEKPYMVMEYIEGSSLKDILKKRGCLPPLEAADIMIQLTDALAVAHKNGIVHRDVKPQNIMIEADGTIKLSDFGIAVIQSTPAITSKEQVMGTVHYMAPEASSGKSKGPLIDIYAAGVTFFELLTGRVPFDDSEPVAIAKKHMHCDIPPVSSIISGISPAYDTVIAKATTKSPLDRYQSAKLMQNDIMKLLRANTKVSKSSWWSRMKDKFGKK